MFIYQNLLIVAVVCLATATPIAEDSKNRETKTATATATNPTGNMAGAANTVTAPVAARAMTTTLARNNANEAAINARTVIPYKGKAPSLNPALLKMAATMAGNKASFANAGKGQALLSMAKNLIGKNKALTGNAGKGMASNVASDMLKQQLLMAGAKMLAQNMAPDANAGTASHMGLAAVLPMAKHFLGLNKALTGNAGTDKAPYVNDMLMTGAQMAAQMMAGNKGPDANDGTALHKGLAAVLPMAQHLLGHNKAPNVNDMLMAGAQMAAHMMTGNKGPDANDGTALHKSLAEFLAQHQHLGHNARFENGGMGMAPPTDPATSQTSDTHFPVHKPHTAKALATDTATASTTNAVTAKLSQMRYWKETLAAFVCILLGFGIGHL